ncbi:MAG: glycoside hydrolase family 18 protein [Capsulimonadales bacterium]|nr:glycoside hydrolase family 18 protein [Capsulimonadales bacterium]
MRRVLGYYPDWVTRVPPDRIDYTLFTHLCHAFARTRPDGTLTLPARAGDLCARARSRGVKTLLSLGGANSNKSLSAIIGDKSAFDRLVDGLVRSVGKEGYDGIDIDWEAHDSAADAEKMNALVTRLRDTLGREVPLTMAVPASSWGGKWFDVRTLLPCLDFINIMTYDYHGPWSDTSGHNANPYPYPGDGGISNTVSIEYWTKTKGFPADKLLLGIPLYGRGFAVRQLGDRTVKGQRAPHEYVGWQEVDALLRMGWKRVRDQKAGVPYLVSPRGDEVISYEDTESAREKGAWAKKQGLSGIFFWEITQDHTDGTHLLVRAAREGFLK